MKLENDSLSTINGEATIKSQSSPILAISTIASARSGKKSAIATRALMIKTPDVSPMELISLSVSCAKLSKEE